MYHRFSDKPEPFKIQQSIFENQIKFLKKRYNFISLKHYAEVLNGHRDDLPDNSIIITIDDGYQDNYTYAYPVLKKHKIPATIFLVADFINKKAWLWSNKLEFILKESKLTEFDFPMSTDTAQFRVDDFKNWHSTQLAMFDYCRTLSNSAKDNTLNDLAKHLGVDVPDEAVADFQPLTWAQVREMLNSGVDFGSHTCFHSILASVTSEELRHEIVDSKREIETKLQVNVESFCYPNGQPKDINENVIEALEQSGYNCAVTTVRGHNKIDDANRFLLKRMSIQGQTDKELLKEVTWNC
ncbi:MAG: polysaccharide deacetylase family protein [Thermotogota bacterium]|nr:polysaccharide deacetylase family protein [Thermotogota bacterium]